MTPEERAVIEAALKHFEHARFADEVPAVEFDLWAAVFSLRASREEAFQLERPSCIESCEWCCDNCAPLAAGVSTTRVDGSEKDQPSWTCNHGPEWLPATFGDLLAGDRIRIGQQETIVTRTSRPAEWHTANGGRRRWDHVELRMDLEANPGMQQYPPDTACEVLCDAERRAVLLLEQGFSGSSIVS